MPHIEPTEGQLAAAYSAIRLPHWPQDLDSALAHALYGRLVRMHAGLLARGLDVNASRRTVARPVVIAPEPPHPAEPAPPARPRPQRAPRRSAPQPQAKPMPVPRQTTLFDPKAAAAGDRSD